MKILHAEELEHILLRLKKYLSPFQANAFENIIFFNSDSFYTYLEAMTGEKISEALKTINPYIPCFLSETNMEIFISMSLSQEEEEYQRLEEAFQERNNLEFIQFIIKADEQDWEKILNTCETIRRSYHSVAYL